MKTFSVTSLRAILGAMVLTAATVSVGYAENLDLDTLRAAAEAGDANAQRDLGKALIFGTGGVTQNKIEGIHLLKLAAAGGDIAAKASLGKILLDGHYAPADPETGARFLEEAAAAGNTRAQATLGGALIWGLALEPDPMRARALLNQAAAKGDIDALRVLGSNLVGGWVLERDVDTGLPMLERAVAAGDTKGKISLGTFLLNGTWIQQDLPRALALFEEAALAGDGRGLQRYGAMLLWSRRDLATAEAYLRRAGEMGEGQAWTTLASGAMWGYLGWNARAKFDEFAERAHNAGETKIAILEAKRRIYGLNMRADGTEAIEGLEQAAEDGNADAAKYLIRIVRDGHRWIIRKEPDRARAYLEGFSDLLTQAEYDQFLLSFEVANARTTTDYKELAEKLDRHTEFKSDWFGQELYAANPNFAMYLLQIDMKRHGTYTGALNGFATQSTLNALWRECRAHLGTRQCDDDVMHPNVIGPLLAR